MMIAGTAVGCSSKGNSSDGGNHDGSTTTNGIITHVTLEANGIDFGDWLYSTNLHKVVIPVGNTGTLYFIDPQSLNITSVSGFPVPSVPDGGFQFHPPDGFMVPDGFHIPDGGFRGFLFGGIQSVAEGNGLLYVVNATDNMLYYVDPNALSILGKVALGGSPDTIRYSSVTKELWVTERVGMGMNGMDQIETFGFGPDGKSPNSTSTAKIAVSGRSGTLYIDNTNSLAYFNGTGSMGVLPPTYAINLSTHAIANNTGWVSGCERPAGFAADEPNKLLFIACSDNGAVSLNISTGQPIQHFMNASQPESLGWNSTKRHLYVPGPSTFIITVPTAGTLSVQGGVPTPYAESNALADEYGNIWSQEQYDGSVLRIKDTATN